MKELFQHFKTYLKQNKKNKLLIHFVNQLKSKIAKQFSSNFSNNKVTKESPFAQPLPFTPRIDERLGKVFWPKHQNPDPEHPRPKLQESPFCSSSSLPPFTSSPIENCGEAAFVKPPPLDFSEIKGKMFKTKF